MKPGRFEKSCPACGRTFKTHSPKRVACNACQKPMTIDWQHFFKETKPATHLAWLKKILGLKPEAVLGRTSLA